MEWSTCVFLQHHILGLFAGCIMCHLQEVFFIILVYEHSFPLELVVDEEEISP